MQDRALPESFVGPSELALSLQLTAVPDVLPLDGVARSTVTVLARDEHARPVARLPLTLQIVASGERQDVGMLSARSAVTGPDGRTRFSYTAPRASTNSAGQSDPGTAVTIRVTPRTEDHANALGRSVVIRLVPSGRVIPAFRVAAGFTFAPSPATAGEATLFSAPYCDAARDGQDSAAACVDDPRRLVTRFAWSFGDGAHAVGQTVSHVFDAPDTYPVRLTVADSFRRESEATRSVRVEAGPAPEPAFDVSPALPTAGAPVVFDAGRTSATRPVVAYEWTLGDGANGRGRVLMHRYARAGVYTVTLTVTDARGGVATAAGEVTVASGDPTALIDVSPQRPAAGQPVSFSGLRSTAGPGRAIVTHAWVFGDAGAAARGSNVTHTYRAAGTYVVTLVVTDDFGASSTARATVTVGEAPAAARSSPEGGRGRLGRDDRGAGSGRLAAARRTSAGGAQRADPARPRCARRHSPSERLLPCQRSGERRDARRHAGGRAAPHRLPLSDRRVAAAGGRRGPGRPSGAWTSRGATRNPSAGWRARRGGNGSASRPITSACGAGSGSSVRSPPLSDATVGLVEGIRVRKDDHEVATLRAAGERLSLVAARVLDAVAAGRSERELAAHIGEALRDAGFERPAFDSIVAGGANSALPHARPTGRRLSSGDLVVLDFGGVHHGYCVDLSRTVCVGRAGAEARRLHEAVRAAQAAALAAIRPGIRASAVDSAAREVLAGLGLAEAFGHSTGHGLGSRCTRRRASDGGRPRGTAGRQSRKTRF